MTTVVDLVSTIVWTFPLAFGYNVIKDATWILKGTIHGKGERTFEQARYS